MNRRARSELRDMTHLLMALGVCEEAGELAPRDCEVLAEICLKRRRPEDALSWVERGLELEEEERWPNRSGWHLTGMRREILEKLDRSDEALDSAWEAYREGPSVHAYEELMKYVPKGDRADWHSRSISALDGARLSARIELLVETGEWERLVEVIEQAGQDELTALSYYTAEPAAMGLAKAHPLQAARLYLALGLRIVEERKSKYYGAAIGHFKTARDILLKEGRDGDWEDVVARIREKHRLKSSFMPGFERLVERPRSGDEPSFLDRARKKWGKKKRI